MDAISLPYNFTTISTAVRIAPILIHRNQQYSWMENIEKISKRKIILLTLERKILFVLSSDEKNEVSSYSYLAGPRLH
jgi:hypothetical protein